LPYGWSFDSFDFLATRRRPASQGREQLTTHSASSSGSSLFPPRPYAIYVTCVLILVTLLSLLDRQIPTLLVGPIKHSFSISDTQFSLLQGSAFAIIYTVMGLPFGRLVDSTNRRNLILFGLIVWSATTISAGFAASYWQLFIARMGTGIGEACLAPAAFSMISDYFAPRARGRATSAYYMSLSLGIALSFAIGGALLPFAPRIGQLVPLIGHRAPWQLLFILVGLPGLLLAPVLLTVREPRRLEPSGAPSAARRVLIREFLAHVARHRATFVLVIGTASAVAIVGYANIAWAPTFFERRFGIPVSASGPVVGLILAVCGSGGSLFSGFLSDRWLRRGVGAARFRVIAATWLFLLPASVAWPLAPTPFAGYVLFAITTIGSAMCTAAGPVIMQEIVPNGMRGQAIASYLLVAGLCGLGLGPSAPALISDGLFHSERALGSALALLALSAGSLGALATWFGLKPYARSWMSVLGAQADGAETPLAPTTSTPGADKSPLGVASEV
jgi:MFS family permease